MRVDRAAPEPGEVLQARGDAGAGEAVEEDRPGEDDVLRVEAEAAPREDDGARSRLREVEARGEVDVEAEEPRRAPHQVRALVDPVGPRLRERRGRRERRRRGADRAGRRSRLPGRRRGAAPGRTRTGPPRRAPPPARPTRGSRGGGGRRAAGGSRGTPLSARESEVPSRPTTRREAPLIPLPPAARGATRGRSAPRAESARRGRACGARRRRPPPARGRGRAARPTAGGAPACSARRGRPPTSSCCFSRFPRISLARSVTAAGIPASFATWTP